MKNLEKIREIIISHFRDSWTFKKTEDYNQFEEIGTLRKNFKLSEVRQWLGNHSYKDEEIFDAIDALAKQGFLKILEAKIYPRMKITDFGFKSIIGEARRSWKHHTGSRITDIKYFSDNPLKQSEIGSKTVINVHKRALAARKKFTKTLDRRYGKITSGIEGRLHKEDLEDQSDLRKQVGEILRVNKALLKQLEEQGSK